MKENINVGTITNEADILERSVLFMVTLLKRHLKKIILAGLLGGIIGGSLSFLLPKRYTSKAELLPEFKESRFSNFSSLASLAGVDLAKSAESDAIRPDLYPNILQSTPALIYLLKQPVKTTENLSFSMLLNYFEKINEKKAILKEFNSVHKQATILNFTKDELFLLSNIRSSISTNFDKKTGIIVISVEMLDPMVAATTLSSAIQYLTNFVSDYRSKKKHDQSEFIRLRVAEASKQLQNSEYALQRYRDNNRNVIMNVAKIEEQKLQANYLHAQNLRNDLLNQLEQATLAEKEGQPVIQILEPPIVSINKSSPSRIIFVVVGAFLSSLATLLFFSFRHK